MTASRTSERLPNWTLEETLLAWELYLAEYADPLRYPDGAHEAVKRLSQQLRNLTIHPASVRSSERFRTHRVWPGRSRT